MPRRVNEQHQISAFCRALLAQYKQAGGYARPVEDVLRQRDHSFDQPGIDQRLSYQVLVVSLAVLHLWIAVVIEFAGLLLDLGLTTEKHALRADNPCAPIVTE